jgi:hypothetical protein
VTSLSRSPSQFSFTALGRITSTRLLSFVVHRSHWVNPGSTAESGEAFDLVMIQGSIFVEIDGWLKALFGGQLEDAWIRHFVFFRWHGSWMGMLEGRERSTGRVKRAYLDLTKNTILFPPQDSLRSAGSDLVPDSAS